MMRDTTQTAAVADRLVARLHSKGIRFTKAGPSEDAWIALEAMTAAPHRAALITGFRATYNATLVRALEASWTVRVDDRQRLILACEDAPQREVLRRNLALLADRVHVLGLRDVGIVDTATSIDLTGSMALMLRIALDVWNQDGRALVGEVLGRVDGDNLELIGSLFLAYAEGHAAAFDRWLEAHALEARHG